jgi:hypothetical protein
MSQGTGQGSGSNWRAGQVNEFGDEVVEFDHGFGNEDDGFRGLDFFPDQRNRSNHNARTSPYLPGAPNPALPGGPLYRSWREPLRPRGNYSGVMEHNPRGNEGDNSGVGWAFLRPQQGQSSVAGVVADSQGSPTRGRSLARWGVDASDLPQSMGGGQTGGGPTTGANDTRGVSGDREAVDGRISPVNDGGFRRMMEA